MFEIVAAEEGGKDAGCTDGIGIEGAEEEDGG